MDCVFPEIDSGELFATLRRRRARRGALPISGSLEMTSRCNWHCRHCYLRPPLASDAELDTLQFCALFDALAAREVLSILLTGGEPLLRRDFKDLYRHAKQCGFLITLFTNASLIDDGMADFLAEWSPRRIEITLYGSTPATWDAVTSVAGSFAQAHAGIACLLKRNLPVAFKTMGLRANVDELTAMRRWAVEECGAPFRFDPWINPRLTGHRAPLTQRLAASPMARLLNAAPDTRTAFLRLERLGRQKSPLSNKRFTCGAGTRTFHIDAAGRLFPCLLWRGHPIATSEPAAWERWLEYVAALRCVSNRADECRACLHRFACPRCPAVAQLERGAAAKKIPFYCSVMSALANLNSRLFQ
jgi:radical SAM protein with 4Fe4S-binding SPASM domain